MLAVRVHGVDVDWVRFPAARKAKFGVGVKGSCSLSSILSAPTTKTKKHLIGVFFVAPVSFKISTKIKVGVRTLWSRPKRILNSQKYVNIESFQETLELFSVYYFSKLCPVENFTMIFAEAGLL